MNRIKDILYDELDVLKRHLGNAQESKVAKVAELRNIELTITEISATINEIETFLQDKNIGKSKEEES